jgi:F420-dependent methylenetetrahydromethanopterin dehydrogenase
VNLPVLGSRFWLLARSDSSRFFIAFVIFQSPATTAVQGAKVVVAQGAEMAVVEGEAEKTRRRDDLEDDFGEAVVATAIYICTARRHFMLLNKMDLHIQRIHLRSPLVTRSDC